MRLTQMTRQFLRDSLNLKLENWWRPGFCVSSEVSKTSISAWKHRSTHFSGDMLYYVFFIRQEVKLEIRLAERIYVKSQIINSKGNTNSIWKVINRCLPKKSSGLPQFNDSHENMASSFNTYFSSVGSLTALKACQLAKDQNWTLDSNAYETFNVSTPSELFEFQPVSDNDAANIILNLPSNKAPDFDKVPVRILKDSYRPLCK